MTIDQRHIFPAALLVMNLGAAVMSFKAGEFRRCVYWVASAVSIAMIGFA